MISGTGRVVVAHTAAKSLCSLLGDAGKPGTLRNGTERELRWPRSTKNGFLKSWFDDVSFNSTFAKMKITVLFTVAWGGHRSLGSVCERSRSECERSRSECKRWVRSANTYVRSANAEFGLRTPTFALSDR